MGALLSALLTTQGGLAWTAGPADRRPCGHRLLVHLSLRLVRGARHAARAAPASARVIVSALAAAALSSAMWLVFARGWTALVVSRWAGQTGPTFAAIQSLLFGIGVLLYLLVARRELRPGRLRSVAGCAAAGTAGTGAGEGSGAAIAPRADRSALSLQQPELDQRADDGGSPGARRMCLLLGEFLRETPGARRRGSHHAVEGAGTARSLSCHRARSLRRPAARGAARRRCRRLLRAAAAAAADRRERRHPRHRAPHRGRYHPGQRRSRPGPGCALSSRTRAIPIGRSAAAPASGWRTCGPGCARCTERTRR